MGDAFGQHHQQHRHIAHPHQIERAVFLVGLKQPVEADQRGQHYGRKAHAETQQHDLQQRAVARGDKPQRAGKGIEQRGH